jgi:hypothetical protein
MTKAIILTTQRTGSTFLVECLDSHPDVRCIGEMLAGGHIWVPEFVYRSRYATKAYRYLGSGAWNPVRMMNRYFARTDRPVMCFKAMYNHIRPPWTIQYLREHAEILILHLRRHNLLKQYVSRALLSVARDKSWQPHATEPVTPTSIAVSPDAALAYMRRIRAEHARHEAMFSGHRRYQLSYETMIDGQTLRSDVAREVCAFLGISAHPMKSKLIKMNPVDLRDMVKNYDELAAAIHGTEFEDLLDAT